MAVKIRLRRMGEKRNAIYRVIVADSRSPRDGRFIEEIGTYNPNVEPMLLQLTKKQLRNGYQPVLSLLKLLADFSKMPVSRNNF